MIKMNYKLDRLKQQKETLMNALEENQKIMLHNFLCAIADYLENPLLFEVIK